MCLLFGGSTVLQMVPVTLLCRLPPQALVEVVPIGEQRKVQSLFYTLQVIKFLSNIEEERSLKSHHVAAGSKSLQQEQWLLQKKI